MSNVTGARALDSLQGRIASQRRPGRAAPQHKPDSTCSGSPLPRGRGVGGEGDFSDWLPAVSPNWSWQAPHLRLLQQELQQVTEGKVDRLMLFLPPRHGKSELVTVRYPVFRLEQNPETRVIIGAYNQALAERFSRKARRLARERFALSRDRNSAWEWETAPIAHPHTHTPTPSHPSPGGVRAVGVGGGITGLGADLILIDDPVKSREEAESATYRDRVWDWYRDDLYTRQEPGCAIILVMTRWHEDDLAGRILKSEEGGRWRVVRLPALAEADSDYRAWSLRLRSGRHGCLDPTGEMGLRNENCEMRNENWVTGEVQAGGASLPFNSQFALLTSQFSIPTGDPLGRSEGAALWPERFTAADLARIKTALGTRSFAALYQGRPLPAEGGLFKREWFRFIEIGELGLRNENCELRNENCGAGEDQGGRAHPASNSQFSVLASQFSIPKGTRWVRFWDTAAKAGQRSDYWAGALLGRTPEGEWILAGMVRGRWEYPEAKRRVLATAAADGADVPVVIEDSASGCALLQDLRQDPLAEEFRFRGVKVAVDKAVRAGAWASQAETGKFRLVRGVWNAAFLEELESFPHGAHDDQVDAVSGAYHYLAAAARVRLPVSLAGRPR